MNTEHTFQSAVGLRHVIEDGISILAGRNIAEKRKQYVLDDLQGLFGEVVRGSELVHSNSLFIGQDDRRAFEAYSLFDRYLPDQDTELTEKLRAVAAAFGEIKSGQSITDLEAIRLTAFLRAILASLSRQDSAGLPNEPEQVKILSL